MAFTLGMILPLPARLWIGRMLFPSEEPKAVRVSPHRLIKGPCNPLELEAMRYVAEHTSIPVPKVHAVHHREGELYIEMEFVKGINLASAWMKKDLLSADQKKSILRDVGDSIGQLRQLVPPTPGTVCSALQNAAHDSRIGSHLFGPLSHDEFHSLIRGDLGLEASAKEFGEQAVMVHTSKHESRFTHGELRPGNIMVKDGHVIAMVDWASAGWYPEYWEFTKAHYGMFPLSDWYDGLYEVIPRYDTELLAERSLWTKCDEPGNPRG